jgi:gliding motility-associated-like protein
MRHLTKKLLLLCITLCGFLSLYSQNCSDTVYKFRYFSADSIYAHDHIVTSDNGSAIVGETRNYPVKKGLLIRLDAQGDIIWSKQMQGKSQLDLNKVLEASDGSLILGGIALHQNSFSRNIFLAKLSADGKFIWQKFYALNNNNNLNPLELYDVTEGINGDVLITWQRTSINTGTNDETWSSQVMRVNSNGEIMWSKYLTIAGYGVSNLSGIFLNNGRIAVVGELNDINMSCQGPGGSALILMELDYVDGKIQQQKMYCFQEIRSDTMHIESADHHFRATKLAGGNFALFGTFFHRNANTYRYKVIFDQQLNIQQSRLYASPYESGHGSALIQVLPSGETAIVNTNLIKQISFYGFVDNNEHILNEKAIQGVPDVIAIYSSYNFSYRSSDWSFRERGTSRLSFVRNLSVSSRRYIEFTTMDKRSVAAACVGSDSSFISILPFHLTVGSWSWGSVVENRIISDAATYTVSDYAMQKEVVCTLADNCTALNIKGPDTVCFTGKPVDFIAAKGNCGKQVTWKFDPAWISVAQQVNDSVIRLQFKQPVGAPVKIKLHASFSDCVIQDSLEVALFPSANSLPPDTIICGAVNMRLSPGNTLRHYTWQDGSTTADYIVTTKGMYSVNTEDHCGNIFSDSIVIRDPYVSLGNDTTICIGDAMNITANKGFLRYDWTASAFVQVSDNVIQVSPSTASRYIVTATTVNGCIAKDTVQVNVHPAVSDFIIADTAMCSYDDLTLKTFTPFNSYLWNDGSTSASIKINKAGTYSLQVTNQYGCKGKQNITVRLKECPSYVYFPSAFSPNNDNRNDIFKPVTAGRFAHYVFEVYNRWGERIFSSTDAKNGWDGRVAGMFQSSGAFVWRCEYQLQGEERVIKKGTVIVVR